MRFLRSRVLFVAAVASLLAAGSLAIGTAAPAGAVGPGITVHCPTDDLQAAINNAPPGSTIKVDGTCVGNFNIWTGNALTVNGPATLDGNGAGLTLQVTGTVVLNDLTIQHGNGFGGGLWNQGHLTMNRSIVRNNTGDGVLNGGQLTMSLSTVSNNTSDYYGGINNSRELGPERFDRVGQRRDPRQRWRYLQQRSAGRRHAQRFHRVAEHCGPQRRRHCK
jgi:hypothetical protein